MNNEKNVENRRLFMRFQESLKSLGFRQLSQERKIRDLQRRGLVPPKRPRIKELKYQKIFVLEMDGYIITVLSSYDELIYNFTKAGRLSVLVAPFVKEGSKKNKPLLWRHFHRRGDFLRRAEEMVKFLVDRLENRPADTRGDLMDLKFFNQSGYFWVSQNDKIEKVSFLPKQNEIFYEYGHKWAKEVRYYEKVVRPRKGIKNRAKDIRKDWKRKPGRKKK